MNSRTMLAQIRSRSCYPASRGVIAVTFWALILAFGVVTAYGLMHAWHLATPAPEGMEHAPDTLVKASYALLGVLGIVLSFLAKEGMQIGYDVADAIVEIAANTHETAQRSAVGNPPRNPFVNSSSA